MLALGYDEAISITFISEQEAQSDLQARRPSRWPSANPLSEEAGYMRTSLLPGLLNMVGYNLNRGNTDVRLFEAGEVFEKLGDAPRRAPPPRLRRHRRRCSPRAFTRPAQPYTFFHMKGDIEELLAAFAASVALLRRS